MRYLLDTHAAIWAFEEGPKLSSRVRNLILDRSPADFFIADATVMEVARLIAGGRYPVSTDPIVALEKLCTLFKPIQMTIRIAWRSVTLNWTHRDPADRMICATALENDLILITRDRKITEWGGVPIFW